MRGVKKFCTKRMNRSSKCYVAATLSVAVVHALLNKEEDQGEAKKEFQIPERIAFSIYVKLIK